MNQLENKQTIEVTQEIHDQALEQVTGGSANSENNLEGTDNCISNTMSLDQKELLQIPNARPGKFA